MKKLITICAVAGLIFVSSGIALGAIPVIWYDAEKQAIGVNPYADGYGPPDIAIDFDSDHSSAGRSEKRA
jgi:hypothetical protein